MPPTGPTRWSLGTAICSGSTEPTKQALDIKRIVSEVAMLVRTRLEQQHVALTMALDDTLPPVAGDRVELQQVLLNLFVNSIEAMEIVAPRSRRLTIETRRTGEHLVQITVQDTGPGMRDVDVSRLFAPFYTTKAHGTGVGLSLSRAIVEAHGGQLWAEPEQRSWRDVSFHAPGGRTGVGGGRWRVTGAGQRRWHVRTPPLAQGLPQLNWPAPLVGSAIEA